MKKTIVVLFLIFLFSNLSNAQIYKGFGVKLGTSIANQTSNLFSTNLNYKFGFTGGVFKESHIFEKLNIVTGINYVQKGALDPFIQTSETGQYLGTDYFHRNVNYASLEVLAKYDGNTGTISPYILAGVRMDIFISAKNVLNGKELTPSEYSYPINNNRIFGATIGMGIDYRPSKKYSVFIESTYNPDFNFNKMGESLIYLNNTWEVENYSFDIRTGIKF
jgi:hypothetical protein